ncbi:MAG TPA: MBL fold metallo-hydrolase [Bacillales bacterium]|nr:MBL fold metallo-hydrolase [Bacillales bacterium]
MVERMDNPLENTFLPVTSVASGAGTEVLTDVYCYTDQIVNLCFIGDPPRNEWIMIDTGMPGNEKDIVREAEERFGEHARPRAIILTHGHFDHVGTVVELVKHWDVPVYAHKLEMPYLTGRTAYPQPDASVEGGMVAKMSPMFPTAPVDLGHHISHLPEDGTVPEAPNWRWIHTPGHSPGHVSLFRKDDHTLIAGDAFVTVRQDSLYKVFTQQAEINGPPRYLTTNWQAAWDSVKKLQQLQPETAVTGHGPPMSGTALAQGLRKLANEFETLAVPDHGRYLDH